MLNVQFKQWHCIVEFGEYSGINRTAIILRDTEDGQPVATATVNIPEINMIPEEVFIKDYSENEGMAQALVQAGIIEPMWRSKARSGHVILKSYRLTQEAQEEFTTQKDLAQQSRDREEVIHG